MTTRRDLRAILYGVSRLSDIEERISDFCFLYKTFIRVSVAKSLFGGAKVFISADALSSGDLDQIERIINQTPCSKRVIVIVPTS